MWHAALTCDAGTVAYSTYGLLPAPSGSPNTHLPPRTEAGFGKRFLNRSQAPQPLLKAKQLVWLCFLNTGPQQPHVPDQLKDNKTTNPPRVFLRRVSNSLGAMTRAKVWPHDLPATMYLWDSPNMGWHALVMDSVFFSSLPFPLNKS